MLMLLAKTIITALSVLITNFPTTLDVSAVMQVITTIQNDFKTTAKNIAIRFMAFNGAFSSALGADSATLEISCLAGGCGAGECLGKRQYIIPIQLSDASGGIELMQRSFLFTSPHSRHSFSAALSTSNAYTIFHAALP